MRYFKKHSLSIWIFFLCAILVFITQFTLLQSVLQYRLFNTSEDWAYLILYHSLDLNFWDKLVYVWKTSGLHTSAQVFHIGILSELLGFNYSAYQVVNVVLKAIGTLSFFPLILILFKSRKLAFLATILFGINSATAGSFLWIVKGSEYIGIMLMNIFLITYYFVILKNSKKLLFLSSILFLLAYLMAPPRMFPLVLLFPLIEIYWLLKTRKIRNLKYSILRGVFYILPVILVSLPAPVSPGFPFTKQPFVLLKAILDGNWHNLIDPFSSIGWTLLTNDYWKFLGKLEYETLTNLKLYLTFLFDRPVLIFGILTMLLSRILSNKPRKFFLLVFGLNFMLEILLFILTSHHLYLPENHIKSYPGHFVFTKFPALVGFYIFTVAFACFLEWRNDKEKSNLYMAMWVGVIFSVIFLWPTWIIMGPLINDYSSVHWYFGIPAAGTTLFLAAILILIYDKFKHRRLSRVFAVLFILIIIVVFYQSHGTAITKQYMGVNPTKVSLKDQQKLHEELIISLGDSAKSGDVLVYLEITEDVVNLRRTQEFYKEALVVTKFGDWLHFRRKETAGCIDVIIDKKVLKSVIQLRNNEKGFAYYGKCLDKEKGILVNKENHLYKLGDFYALRIKNGNFINIRDEILGELRLNP